MDPILTFLISFALVSAILIISVRRALTQNAVGNRAKKREPKRSLNPGEVTVKRSAANLLRGAEVVGGFLYLTNSRLLFESHAFNIQTGTTEIDLKDIAEIQMGYTKFLGTIPVFPNVIIIVTNSQEYRLTLWSTLWDGKAWKQAIEKEMKNN